MERYNIILRTLGATMLALALVLIPLSQAEASHQGRCADLEPGDSSGYCWPHSSCGERYLRTEPIYDSIGRQIGYKEIYQVGGFYHETVRPTESPQCTSSDYCSYSCGGEKEHTVHY